MRTVNVAQGGAGGVSGEESGVGPGEVGHCHQTADLGRCSGPVWMQEWGMLE